MTGDESVNLVNFVIATWNMRMDKPVKKQMYKSWHRYLAFFPYDQVMKTVDRHALSSKWAPKPAELWRQLAAPELPSTETAYQQAVALRDSISYGTPRPETAEIIALTSQRFSGRMTERSFAEAYEELCSNYLLNLFEEMNND